VERTTLSESEKYSPSSPHRLSQSFQIQIFALFFKYSFVDLLARLIPVLPLLDYSHQLLKISALSSHLFLNGMHFAEVIYSNYPSE
jgi:hypothetical protein